MPCPMAAASVSARARTAGATPGGAYRPVTAADNNGARLGIARTMGVCEGHSPASASIRTPARIDSSAAGGSGQCARAERSAAAACCGLTASTISVAADSALALSACVLTPYSLLSWSRSSARGSPTRSELGGRPWRSKPAMMARAMLPPPRKAIASTSDSATVLFWGIGFILPKHRVLHGGAVGVAVARLARAEQRRSDPNHRRPFEDGLAKVIAHAHRERVERGALRIQLL